MMCGVVCEMVEWLDSSMSDWLADTHVGGTGVCGIEMIVATAANSLVAWMDMYCRLAAVLNMLYDMEVLDREHESAVVDGHAVARGHVGEITMCRGEGIEGKLFCGLRAL
jgi:hypothetical protein